MNITKWNHVIESFNGKSTNMPYEQLAILLNDLPPELDIEFGKKDEDAQSCEIKIEWNKKAWSLT